MLNLGFYKRMSIKQTFEKPLGGVAEIRVKVAGRKQPLGTLYTISLDNGFRDVSFWESLYFANMIPDRDEYVGNIKFVAYRAGEFMNNSWKIHPHAVSDYMMMENALASCILEVARSIGDKTVNIAPSGLYTY